MKSFRSIRPKTRRSSRIEAIAALSRSGTETAAALHCIGPIIPVGSMDVGLSERIVLLAPDAEGLIARFPSRRAESSTTVADQTGAVCNGNAGIWLGGAVSTMTSIG